MAEFIPEENNTWKDSGTYDTSELLINNDDLHHLLDHEIDSIHKKINNFGENLGIKNHNIDCTLYNNVYIFSDIHADFRKFCQILFEYDLIKINDANKNDIIDALYMHLDKTPVQDEPMNMYDIFFHIIENFEWNGGEKTLIVLVGDLIDGKRHPAEVYDPIGIFELLIHSLIHNIRIKSRIVNSDMLFTFGNHDYYGCFNNSYEYKGYVHKSCLTFYGDRMITRQTFLRPFYINSPYLFLNLQYDGKTKIKCVHAGIHDLYVYPGNKNLGKRIDESLLNQSQELLNAINFSNIYSFDWKKLDDITNNILNDRPYYNLNQVGKDGCDYITYDEPLIIVGHCPTSQSTKQEITKLQTNQYTNCDYLENDPSKAMIFANDPAIKGCVVVGCSHENQTPKLIYVDSALSNSFRKHNHYIEKFGTIMHIDERNRITNNFNKNRHVEILKLSREGLTPDAKYYYNILERLNSGEGANNITIYQTPSNNLSELAVVGKDDNNGKKGGKKTNKKYKKSYKKYKKQTRKRTTRKRRTKK